MDRRPCKLNFFLTYILNLTCASRVPRARAHAIVVLFFLISIILKKVFKIKYNNSPP